MKKSISAAVFVSFLFAGAALACDGETHQVVKEVSVPQVAELQKSGQVTLVDANFSEFRVKHGVIPGAVLLSSYKDYQPAKELPSDKSRKLIFYCANQRCTASHFAATRAVEAGYADVSVLPDGLSGWRRAGKPISIPQS